MSPISLMDMFLLDIGVMFATAPIRGFQIMNPTPMCSSVFSLSSVVFFCPVVRFFL